MSELHAKLGEEDLTDFFRDEYEDQARQNLERSLAKLKT